MCWHAKMLVINFLVKKKKYKAVYYSPTSVKKHIYAYVCEQKNSFKVWVVTFNPIT